MDFQYREHMQPRQHMSSSTSQWRERRFNRTIMHSSSESQWTKFTIGDSSLLSAVGTSSSVEVGIGGGSRLAATAYELSNPVMTRSPSCCSGSECGPNRTWCVTTSVEESVCSLWRGLAWQRRGLSRAWPEYHDREATPGDLHSYALSRLTDSPVPDCGHAGSSVNRGGFGRQRSDLGGGGRRKGTGTAGSWPVKPPNHTYIGPPVFFRGWPIMGFVRGKNKAV
jgi:hypothetical protein